MSLHRTLNSRGMGVGQLFTFLVLIVTFAVIMLFGYTAIGGFLKTGEQVEFVQFKSDVEAAFQRLTTEYGSVRIKEFHLPPQYRQICFVDMEMGEEGFTDAGTDGDLDEEISQLRSKDPIAASVYEHTSALDAHKRYESVDENVFLTPPALVQIKVARIKIKDRESASTTTEVVKRAFQCFPIDRGSFKVQLEGKGSYTLVSDPPSSR